VLEIGFLRIIPQGSCIVQATQIPFSSEELVDQVERCGVNHISQFPTFLARHLQRARQDAKLLSILRNLDEVLYGGLPLAREEEEWACQNGIKLRVRPTIFVNTSSFLLYAECFWKHRMWRPAGVNWW
jgi:hypothetical protein